MVLIHRNAVMCIALSLLLLAVSGSQAGFCQGSGASLTSWTQLNAQGVTPGPLYGYTMTEGPANTCFIFGGYDQLLQKTRNDIFQVKSDGVWTSLSTQGIPPNPRFYSAGIYDAPGEQLVFLGGNDGGIMGGNITNDICALNLKTNTWTRLVTQGPDPLRKFQHTAVFDSARRRMVVFGGTDVFNPLILADNNLYFLDLATLTWTRFAPSLQALPDVEGHTAVYLPDQDAMVIFGGDSGGYGYLHNEVYLISFPANTVSRLATTGTPHPPVIGATSFYDSRYHRLFIYGGRQQDGTMAGLSVLNMQTLQWEPTDAIQSHPDSRSGMQMRMIAAPDKFLLFGGMLSSSGYSNISGESWLLTLGQIVPVTLSRFMTE